MSWKYFLYRNTLENDIIILNKRLFSPEAKEEIFMRYSENERIEIIKFIEENFGKVEEIYES